MVMLLQHYLGRFLYIDFPDEARKATRVFLSLIPAGISRIIRSHNSNMRKRERKKENERCDQSAQVRLDKLED